MIDQQIETEANAKTLEETPVPMLNIFLLKDQNRKLAKVCKEDRTIASNCRDKMVTMETGLKTINNAITSIMAKFKGHLDRYKKRDPTIAAEENEKIKKKFKDFTTLSYKLFYPTDETDLNDDLMRELFSTYFSQILDIFLQAFKEVSDRDLQKIIEQIQSDLQVKSTYTEEEESKFMRSLKSLVARDCDTDKKVQYLDGQNPENEILRLRAKVRACEGDMQKWLNKIKQLKALQGPKTNLNIYKGIEKPQDEKPKLRKPEIKIFGSKVQSDHANIASDVGENRLSLIEKDTAQKAINDLMSFSLNWLTYFKSDSVLTQTKIGRKLTRQGRELLDRYHELSDKYNDKIKLCNKLQKDCDEDIHDMKKRHRKEIDILSNKLKEQKKELLSGNKKIKEEIAQYIAKSKDEEDNQLGAPNNYREMTQRFGRYIKELKKDIKTIRSIRKEDLFTEDNEQIKNLKTEITNLTEEMLAQYEEYMKLAEDNKLHKETSADYRLRNTTLISEKGELMIKVAGLENKLLSIKETHGLNNRINVENEKIIGQLKEENRILKELDRNNTQKIDNLNTQLNNYGICQSYKDETNRELLKELNLKKEEIQNSMLKSISSSNGECQECSQGKEMIKRYRNKLLCKIWRSFEVSTALSCGHLYCQNCINDNFSARIRKCGYCKASLSSKDVYQIKFI